MHGSARPVALRRPRAEREDDTAMGANTGKEIELGQRAPQVLDEGGVAKVHLTLAIADYDHVRDLVHGVVRADGIALTLDPTRPQIGFVRSQDAWTIWAFCLCRKCFGAGISHHDA